MERGSEPGSLDNALRWAVDNGAIVRCGAAEEGEHPERSITVVLASDREESRRAVIELSDTESVSEGLARAITIVREHTEAYEAELHARSSRAQLRLVRE